MVSMFRGCAAREPFRRCSRLVVASLVASAVAACGGSGGSGGDSGPGTGVGAGTGAAGSPVAGQAGAIPTPESIAGLPEVGRITAHSGQVIENLHVITSNGPCIVIPDGVSDVTIRNVEVGPCGQPGDVLSTGVDIAPGSTRITIERNVIHDVASGIYARGAMHPIVIDRNLIYNVRGPTPRGQAVQFNGVSDGSSASRITCNVSDTTLGPWSNVEDHISFFDSPGLPADRTVVAYNRLRGGSPTYEFGSGIMIADGFTGGHVWAHHNTVVNVANAGMGIAGGRNVTLEANRIFLDGVASRSRVGLVVQNFMSNECVDHLVIGNRVWAIDVLGSSGTLNHAHFSSACTGVTQVDNLLGDPTLGAFLFDETPAECR
jgi:hypothetical protein